MIPEGDSSLPSRRAGRWGRANRTVGCTRSVERGEPPEGVLQIGRRFLTWETVASSIFLRLLAEKQQQLSPLSYFR
jgi:hypothetical protein